MEEPRLNEQAGKRAGQAETKNILLTLAENARRPGISANQNSAPPMITNRKTAGAKRLFSLPTGHVFSANQNSAPPVSTNRKTAGAKRLFSLLGTSFDWGGHGGVGSWYTKPSDGGGEGGSTQRQQKSCS